MSNDTARANSVTGLSRRLGWHRQPALRKIVFKVLRSLGDRDITIEHHWAPKTKIRLNAFRHRGYWFHGKALERGVMASFSKLLKPGDTVIEVGGHIGYTTIHLARLVGTSGKLRVFEPSADNLLYLRRNTAALPQVKVVPLGVSDKAGKAAFYVEGLSGQNSSLLPNYQTFADSRANAFSDDSYRKVEIETTTLDAFLEAEGLEPDLIKIDIEGAELLALKGMQKCLAVTRPVMMVEVTEDAVEVMAMFADARYVAYNSNLVLFANTDGAHQNRFFVPEEKLQSFRLSV